jgi:hypothetical protein
MAGDHPAGKPLCRQRYLLEEQEPQLTQRPIETPVLRAFFLSQAPLLKLRNFTFAGRKVRWSSMPPLPEASSGGLA